MIIHSYMTTVGLDDARNTAMLCIRLINDGCVLRITKSIQALEV